MTNQIHKFISIWWIRILVYILFSSLLLVSFDQLLNSFNLENIIFDNYLTREFIFFFVLILMSIIIESFRAAGSWYSFGIILDKQTVKNSLMIFCIVFIAFFLILLLAYEFSADIKLSNITFSAFLYFIILIFLTSSTEELIFRGIFFQAIQQRFGSASAIFWTSIIFGLLHLFNPSFDFLSLLNTILAGVLLGFLYIKSSSLIVPISFHFFWNFGQSFIINSNVSGFDMYLKLFEINLTTLPHYLFGGNYGIEGGLITTIILFLAFPIFNKLIKPSVYMNSILLYREIAESKLN